MRNDQRYNSVEPMTQRDKLVENSCDKLVRVQCSAIPFQNRSQVELAWRSGSIMDFHATARGSIPGGNDVFTELHVLCKGQ